MRGGGNFSLSHCRMLNSQMAVNLLGLAILAEQSSQCPHPSHPDYLLRESGIRCTFPFTISWTGVKEGMCGRGRGGRGRSEGRKGNEGERKGGKTTYIATQ